MEVALLSFHFAFFSTQIEALREVVVPGFFSLN